jgi:hypothetical protein
MSGERETTHIPTVIPAQPGWRSAWFWSEADNPDHLQLGSAPVIGWVVMPTTEAQYGGGAEFVSCQVKAVLPFGNDDDGDLLIDPKGVFHFGFEAGQGTEQEAKERWAEKYKRAKP